MTIPIPSLVACARADHKAFSRQRSLAPAITLTEPRNSCSVATCMHRRCSFSACLHLAVHVWEVLSLQWATQLPFCFENFTLGHRHGRVGIMPVVSSRLSPRYHMMLLLHSPPSMCMWSVFTSWAVHLGSPLKVGSRWGSPLSLKGSTWLLQEPVAPAAGHVTTPIRTSSLLGCRAPVSHGVLCRQRRDSRNPGVP